MNPFVASYLVAAGPYVMPLLLVGLTALAGLSGWLIEIGLSQRRYGRAALGFLIAAYLAAVALAAAGINN